MAYKAQITVIQEKGVRSIFSSPQQNKEKSTKDKTNKKEKEKDQSYEYITLCSVFSLHKKI
jgi:hypothetical protein